MTATPEPADEPAGPPRIRAYLKAIIRVGAEQELALVSVILFGSAATGGFAGAASDVDLILVLPDGAPRSDRVRLREEVERLEALHGFRDASAHPLGALDTFARKITANVRSFFVCTRGDLISGEVARILDIPEVQALFVDRVVVPNIVGSSITVWGEDLLPLIPTPPIRRFDVLKAFFGFWNQVLLSAALFPMVPSATKYAMGALKRSVHNCYFCCHLRPAPLDEEIAFFQERLGPNRTLTQLMNLRRDYVRSLGFVIRCLPTLARLHIFTTVDNRFPREIPRGASSKDH